jgi:hypothetical protein
MTPAITAIIISICIIVSAVSIKYMGANNPVEKVAEEVIQEETGIKLDLTPTQTTTPPAK